MATEAADNPEHIEIKEIEEKMGEPLNKAPKEFLPEGKTEHRHGETFESVLVEEENKIIQKITKMEVEHVKNRGQSDAEQIEGDGVLVSSSVDKVSCEAKTSTPEDCDDAEIQNQGNKATMVNKSIVTNRLKDQHDEVVATKQSSSGENQNDSCRDENEAAMTEKTEFVSHQNILESSETISSGHAGVVICALNLTEGRIIETSPLFLKETQTQGIENQEAEIPSPVKKKDAEEMKPSDTKYANKEMLVDGMENTNNSIHTQIPDNKSEDKNGNAECAEEMFGSPPVNALEKVINAAKDEPEDAGNIKAETRVKSDQNGNGTAQAIEGIKAATSAENEMNAEPSTVKEACYQKGEEFATFKEVSEPRLDYLLNRTQSDEDEVNGNLNFEINVTSNSNLDEKVIESTKDEENAGYSSMPDMENLSLEEEKLGPAEASTKNDKSGEAFIESQEEIFEAESFGNNKISREEKKELCSVAQHELKLETLERSVAAGSEEIIHSASSQNSKISLEEQDLNRDNQENLENENEKTTYRDETSRKITEEKNMLVVDLNKEAEGAEVRTANDSDVANLSVEIVQKQSDALTKQESYNSEIYEKGTCITEHTSEKAANTQGSICKMDVHIPKKAVQLHPVENPQPGDDGNRKENEREQKEDDFSAELQSITERRDENNNISMKEDESPEKSSKRFKVDTQQPKTQNDLYMLEIPGKAANELKGYKSNTEVNETGDINIQTIKRTVYDDSYVAVNDDENSKKEIIRSKSTVEEMNMRSIVMEIEVKELQTDSRNEDIEKHLYGVETSHYQTLQIIREETNKEDIKEETVIKTYKKDIHREDDATIVAAEETRKENSSKEEKEEVVGEIDQAQEIKEQIRRKNDRATAPLAQTMEEKTTEKIYEEEASKEHIQQNINMEESENNNLPCSRTGEEKADAIETKNLIKALEDEGIKQRLESTNSDEMKIKAFKCEGELNQSNPIKPITRLLKEETVKENEELFEYSSISEVFKKEIKDEMLYKEEPKSTEEIEEATSDVADQENKTNSFDRDSREMVPLEVQPESHREDADVNSNINDFSNKNKEIYVEGEIVKDTEKCIDHQAHYELHAAFDTENQREVATMRVSLHETVSKNLKEPSIMSIKKENQTQVVETENDTSNEVVACCNKVEDPSVTAIKEKESVQKVEELTHPEDSSQVQLMAKEKERAKQEDQEPDRLPDPNNEKNFYEPEPLKFAKQETTHEVAHICEIVKTLNDEETTNVEQERVKSIAEKKTMESFNCDRTSKASRDSQITILGQDDQVGNLEIRLGEGKEKQKPKSEQKAKDCSHGIEDPGEEIKSNPSEKVEDIDATPTKNPKAACFDESTEKENSQISADLKCKSESIPILKASEEEMEGPANSEIITSSANNASEENIGTEYKWSDSTEALLSTTSMEHSKNIQVNDTSVSASIIASNTKTGENVQTSTGKYAEDITREKTEGIPRLMSQLQTDDLDNYTKIGSAKFTETAKDTFEETKHSDTRSKFKDQIDEEFHESAKIRTEKKGSKPVEVTSKLKCESVEAFDGGDTSTEQNLSRIKSTEEVKNGISSKIENIAGESEKDKTSGNKNPGGPFSKSPEKTTCLSNEDPETNTVAKSAIKPIKDTQSDSSSVSIMLKKVDLEEQLKVHTRQYGLDMQFSNSQPECEKNIELKEDIQCIIGQNIKAKNAKESLIKQSEDDNSLEPKLICEEQINKVQNINPRQDSNLIEEVNQVPEIAVNENVNDRHNLNEEKGIYNSKTQSILAIQDSTIQEVKDINATPVGIPEAKYSKQSTETLNSNVEENLCREKEEHDIEKGSKREIGDDYGLEVQFSSSPSEHEKIFEPKENTQCITERETQQVNMKTNGQQENDVIMKDFFLTEEAPIGVEKTEECKNTIKQTIKEKISEKEFLRDQSQDDNLEPKHGSKHQINKTQYPLPWKDSYLKEEVNQVPKTAENENKKDNHNLNEEDGTATDVEFEEKFDELKNKNQPEREESTANSQSIDAPTIPIENFSAAKSTEKPSGISIELFSKQQHHDTSAVIKNARDENLIQDEKIFSSNITIQGTNPEASTEPDTQECDSEVHFSDSAREYKKSIETQKAIQGSKDWEIEVSIEEKVIKQNSQSQQKEMSINVEKKMQANEQNKEKQEDSTIVEDFSLTEEVLVNAEHDNEIVASSKMNEEEISNNKHRNMPSINKSVHEAKEIDVIIIRNSKVVDFVQDTGRTELRVPKDQDCESEASREEVEAIGKHTVATRSTNQVSIENIKEESTKSKLEGNNTYVDPVVPQKEENISKEIQQDAISLGTSIITSGITSRESEEPPYSYPVIEETTREKLEEASELVSQVDIDDREMENATFKEMVQVEKNQASDAVFQSKDQEIEGRNECRKIPGEKQNDIDETEKKINEAFEPRSESLHQVVEAVVEGVDTDDGEMATVTFKELIPVEENQESDTVFESKDKEIKGNHECREIPDKKQNDTDETENKINEGFEARSECIHQIAESMVEGKSTDEHLEKSIEHAKQQGHKTSTITSNMGDYYMKTDTELVDENLEGFFGKSTTEMEFVKKLSYSPIESEKAVDPEETISCRFLDISKDKDLENLVKLEDEGNDIPISLTTVQKNSPREVVGEKGKEALHLEKNGKFMEAFIKLEENKITECLQEAMNALKAKEIHCDKNQSTSNQISSEKIEILEQAGKDSHLDINEGDSGTKCCQKNEINAEKYPRVTTDASFETKLKEHNEKMSEEYEAAYTDKNTKKETTNEDIVVEDLFQASVGDIEISDLIQEKGEEVKNEDTTFESSCQSSVGDIVTGDMIREERDEVNTEDTIVEYHSQGSNGNVVGGDTLQEQREELQNKDTTTEDNCQSSVGDVAVVDTLREERKEVNNKNKIVEYYYQGSNENAIVGDTLLQEEREELKNEDTTTDEYCQSSIGDITLSDTLQQSEEVKNEDTNVECQCQDLVEDVTIGETFQDEEEEVKIEDTSDKAHCQDLVRDTTVGDLQKEREKVKNKDTFAGGYQALDGDEAVGDSFQEKRDEIKNKDTTTEGHCQGLVREAVLDDTLQEISKVKNANTTIEGHCQDLEDVVVDNMLQEEKEKVKNEDTIVEGHYQASDGDAAVSDTLQEERENVKKLDEIAKSHFLGSVGDVAVGGTLQEEREEVKNEDEIVESHVQCSVRDAAVDGMLQEETEKVKNKDTVVGDHCVSLVGDVALGDALQEKREEVKNEDTSVVSHCQDLVGDVARSGMLQEEREEVENEDTDVKGPNQVSVGDRAIGIMLQEELKNEDTDVQGLVREVVVSGTLQEIKEVKNKDTTFEGQYQALDGDVVVGDVLQEERKIVKNEDTAIEGHYQDSAEDIAIGVGHQEEIEKIKNEDTPTEGHFQGSVVDVVVGDTLQEEREEGKNEDEIVESHFQCLDRDVAVGDTLKEQREKVKNKGTVVGDDYLGPVGDAALGDALQEEREKVNTEDTSVEGDRDLIGDVGVGDMLQEEREQINNEDTYVESHYQVSVGDRAIGIVLQEELKTEDIDVEGHCQGSIRNIVVGDTLLQIKQVKNEDTASEGQCQALDGDVVVGDMLQEEREKAKNEDSSEGHCQDVVVGGTLQEEREKVKNKDTATEEHFQGSIGDTVVGDTLQEKREEAKNEDEIAKSHFQCSVKDVAVGGTLQEEKEKVKNKDIVVGDQCVGSLGDVASLQEEREEVKNEDTSVEGHYQDLVGDEVVGDMFQEEIEEVKNEDTHVEGHSQVSVGDREVGIMLQEELKNEDIYVEGSGQGLVREVVVGDTLQEIKEVKNEDTTSKGQYQAFDEDIAVGDTLQEEREEVKNEDTTIESHYQDSIEDVAVDGTVQKERENVKNDETTSEDHCQDLVDVAAGDTSQEEREEVKNEDATTKSNFQGLIEDVTIDDTLQEEREEVKNEDTTVKGHYQGLVGDLVEGDMLQEIREEVKNEDSNSEGHCQGSIQVVGNMLQEQREDVKNEDTAAHGYNQSFVGDVEVGDTLQKERKEVKNEYATTEDHFQGVVLIENVIEGDTMQEETDEVKNENTTKGHCQGSVRDITADDTLQEVREEAKNIEKITSRVEKIVCQDASNIELQANEILDSKFETPSLETCNKLGDRNEKEEELEGMITNLRNDDVQKEEANEEGSETSSKKNTGRNEEIKFSLLGSSEDEKSKSYQGDNTNKEDLHAKSTKEIFGPVDKETKSVKDSTYDGNSQILMVKHDEHRKNAIVGEKSYGNAGKKEEASKPAPIRPSENSENKENLDAMTNKLESALLDFSTSSKNTTPPDKQDIATITSQIEIKSLKSTNVSKVKYEDINLEHIEETNSSEDSKKMKELASIEPTKPSLSGLMQKSKEENYMPELGKMIVKTEEMQTGDEMGLEVKKAKVDDNKEEEREGDSGTGHPVTEDVSRSMDVKVAHKKSHNILSGVGSKVKHSISKVKKAITGKSSHSKSHSPK